MMKTSNCSGSTHFFLLISLIQVFIMNIQAGSYAAVFNTKGNVSTLVTVDSDVKLLPDCAKLCERHHCLSFGHNQDQYICRVYSGALITVGENQANGFRFFRKIIDFREKPIALYNLATGTRLSVYGQQIFDVTKENNQGYVFIRCWPASNSVVFLGVSVYGCFYKNDNYYDQHWLLKENNDGTLTFQNVYILKCLSMEGSTVIGRYCSPYSPHNAWVIEFV